MGVKINPDFVKAADKLIDANKILKNAEASGDEEKIQAAEEARHKAEEIYCNLPGMINGEETEDAVEAQINAKMAEVSIFYS